jgi:hypothetical protein
VGLLALVGLLGFLGLLGHEITRALR